ncbi:MAG: DUF4398 domain-containing protein [Woeseiaceae bacterium]|nr:DUF4398 domain-containing protein [Woeseiaceae bacterium]
MLAAHTTAVLRGVLVAALLVVAACESMPVQEMSDARQAISAAREAGAEEHAAERLTAAEAALKKAERFLGTRSYGVARREAVAAKSAAIDALRISEAARDDEN